MSIAINAVEVTLASVSELDRKDDGTLGQLSIQIRKKRYESYNYVWVNSTAFQNHVTDEHLDAEDMLSLGRMGMTPYSGDAKVGRCVGMFVIDSRLMSHVVV